MGVKVDTEMGDSSSGALVNKKDTKETNLTIMNKLGYISEKKFINKNSEELKTLGFDSNKLIEEQIFITHFFRESKASNRTYLLPTQYTSQKFENKFRSIIRKINRSFAKRGSNTKYNLRFICKKQIGEQFIIVADFNQSMMVEKPSNFSTKTQARHRIEKRKQTRGHFSLIYNSLDNTFKVNFASDNFVSDWILRSFVPNSEPDERKVSWHSLFESLISNNTYEIVKMNLAKTDINRRDSLVLKPTRPSSFYRYIESLKRAGIIKNPNLSYLGSLYVRLPKGSTYQVDFTRPNELSIEPRFRKRKVVNTLEFEGLQDKLGFKDRQRLVDSEIDPLDDIFDNIGIRKTIKNLEMSRYHSYSVIADLEKSGLIKIGRIYSYICRSAACIYNPFESKRKLKKCKDCGYTRLYTQEIVEVVPQYETITRNVVKLLNKNGIKAKRADLVPFSTKYTFILAKYQNTDLFLFVNKDGINKKIEEDLLIGVRPFVILNFRGELNDTLFQYGQISGGHVFRLIEEGKLEGLRESMQQSLDTYKEALSPSLKLSTQKLIDIRDKNIDCDLKQAKKGPMLRN